jgi:hypothetical protein
MTIANFRGTYYRIARLKRLERFEQYIQAPFYRDIKAPETHVGARTITPDPHSCGLSLPDHSWTLDGALSLPDPLPGNKIGGHDNEQWIGLGLGIDFNGLQYIGL